MKNTFSGEIDRSGILAMRETSLGSRRKPFPNPDSLAAPGENTLREIKDR
jgi:hypothetical protein